MQNVWSMQRRDDGSEVIQSVKLGEGDDLSIVPLVRHEISWEQKYRRSHGSFDATARAPCRIRINRRGCC